MNIITKILSRLFSKQHSPNYNSGKTFDETYNDFGIFEYNENGFTIHLEDFLEQLKWDEITQLNVYKVDLVTIDRIEMEIVCGDRAFKINEEVPGWYQFIIKTKEVFPSIPKDWSINIINPAFEANYTTIYNRIANQ